MTLDQTIDHVLDALADLCDHVRRSAVRVELATADPVPSEQLESERRTLAVHLGGVRALTSALSRLIAVNKTQAAAAAAGLAPAPTAPAASTSSPAPASLPDRPASASPPSAAPAPARPAASAPNPAAPRPAPRSGPGPTPATPRPADPATAAPSRSPPPGPSRPFAT